MVGVLRVSLAAMAALGISHWGHFSIAGAVYSNRYEPASGGVVGEHVPPPQAQKAVYRRLATK